jgi:hypothetical protein
MATTSPSNPTNSTKKPTVRSETGKVRRVIVVGGGLAGLTTVMKLCEAGVPVLLFSLVPVKRSHSVCAQGGINASVNTKGEGDSPQVHLEETVYGGDFLANQPPVKGMADAAPGIVFMLDRMGVPFNRTDEGLLDFRRFGGTLFHRTASPGNALICIDLRSCATIPRATPDSSRTSERKSQNSSFRTIFSPGTTMPLSSSTSTVS